jgi:transcriptional regulator with XRE-family HTH domain
MATKWRDIRKTLSPEAEERIRKSVEEVPWVMALYQVREARSLTQVNLAKILSVNQGAVSRLEKRTDMYVSTLRSYIQAMGGQLRVTAVFPEGEVEIDQFEKIPPLEAEEGLIEAGESQSGAAAD